MLFQLILSRQSERMPSAAAMLLQFVDRSAGHIPLQLLLLDCVFVAIALVSDTVWALTASAARSGLMRSPRRLELIGGAAGISVAARLLLVQKDVGTGYYPDY
jgi:threonine/homoserine/homoserine lactone efflux protein